MIFSDSSSAEIEQAAWIGSMATAALANLFQPGQAKVLAQAKILGTTSRGVFLLCASNRVIFISKEVFRGPWTINLANPNSNLTAPASGSFVNWDGQTLGFDHGGFRVRISCASEWAPPSRLAALLPPDRVMDNLKTIAAKTIERDGFAPLLACLAGLPGNYAVPAELRPAEQAVRELISFENDGRKPLESFLGVGRGLTPSGDDFIAGYLLAYSRWLPQINANLLPAGLIEEAYHCTTTLSANLIEAASQGSADERILSAADSLFCGFPDPEIGAAQALAYGSSSGIDALTGMATAFLRLRTMLAQHNDS